MRISTLPPAVPAITSDFTPGQTMALLEMRGSELSRAVLVKLLSGTARATIEDYVDLATLGYARRKANSFHELTPRGQFRANLLARSLARQLGIAVVRVTPIRRGLFQPGMMSENGNW